MCRGFNEEKGMRFLKFKLNNSDMFQDFLLQMLTYFSFNHNIKKLMNL